MSSDPCGPLRDGLLIGHGLFHKRVRTNDFTEGDANIRSIG